MENLAELARIDLSDEEKKGLLKDFESILGYIKSIEGVQVDDLKTNYNLTNVWREDAVESREFSHDLIIKQFPDSQDGYLKVKKIL